MRSLQDKSCLEVELTRPLDANPIIVDAHVTEYFRGLYYAAPPRHSIGLLFGQTVNSASGPQYSVCYAMSLTPVQRGHDPWPRLQAGDQLAAQEVAWDLRAYTAFGYWLRYDKTLPSPDLIMLRLSSWIPPDSDIAERFLITTSRSQPQRLSLDAYTYACRDPVIDFRRVQLDFATSTEPLTSTITILEVDT